MTTYMANVYFTKEVCTDNYYEGCDTDYRLVFDQKFTIEFTDTNDLIRQLATYVSTTYFDVDFNEFTEYVTNEIENNRFDYCQNENESGYRTQVTVDNQTAFLADYTFYVNNVAKIVDYVFDEKIC